jgi:hypothetical protein
VLKLNYDVPLSNFAFKLNLRRYTKGKIAGLASAKTELETQLASTTQRLEFAVAQAGVYTRSLLSSNLSRFGHASPCPPV